MSDGKARLKEIADKLRSNAKVEASMTVRELLEHFDAQRRGLHIVREVRLALRAAGLRTDPDFTSAYIDSSVALSLTKKKAASTSPTVAEKLDAEVTTRTIGTLRAAGRLAGSVTPNDALHVATTRMKLAQSAELAVLHGSRSATGIISWTSIGRALEPGRELKHVRDCTQEVPVLPRETPLLDAIGPIVEAGAVLIHDKERTIIGLVTARDIAHEFTALARPFFVLGEIEEHVRRLCRELPVATLQGACDPENPRKITAVHELSLGELVRLVARPKTWQTLKRHEDQPQVVKLLEEIRAIRNDVMHFEPDPPTPDEIRKLDAAERFLRAL